VHEAELRVTCRSASVQQHVLNRMMVVERKGEEKNRKAY
jgi:DUF971 family protein